MRKKDIKFTIVIGTAVVIVIIGVIISNNTNKEPDYSAMPEEERIIAINEKIDKVDLTTLNEMTERERMERYVGKFLEAIRTEKYELAYGMLYEDFKERYFKTQEDFESYAKNKFPSRISAEYTNIERNGDVYVLWVKIGNQLRSKSEAVEMNFIIRENELDKFDLSFSVK